MAAFPGNMLTGVCLRAVVNCAVNMTTVVELYKPQKDFGTGLMVSPISQCAVCWMLELQSTDDRPSRQGDCPHDLDDWSVQYSNAGLQ